ncbi:MAG: amidohydrolase family protein [Actinomadura sp.]
MAYPETIEKTSRPTEQKVMVVDSDIHPAIMPMDLAARLDEPWRARFLDYGARVPGPPAFYPRVRNGGFRLDARPKGGFPGSDLGMVQDQLLDEFDIDYGILIPLQAQSYGYEIPEYAAALCRALNEWIREEWLDADPRLRSSICVPMEAPELAVREIERCAGDPRFVQVLLPTGPEASPGNRKYWPIYEAAVRAGLPIAPHLGGLEKHPGVGWPSYYLESHVRWCNAMQVFAMNYICERVFDHFPTLQVLLVEGGITWAGGLMWAMDSGWSMLRDEHPRLERPPSEYFRDHFWFTTQPIEEPDDDRQLVQSLEHTGMTDRILFASDYPHWDFDSPKLALQDLPRELRKPIMGTNACRLYGLPIEGEAR